MTSRLVTVPYDDLDRLDRIAAQLTNEIAAMQVSLRTLDIAVMEYRGRLEEIYVAGAQAPVAPPAPVVDETPPPGPPAHEVLPPLEPPTQEDPNAQSPVETDAGEGDQPPTAGPAAVQAGTEEPARERKPRRRRASPKSAA